ncbi:DegT/DnrJ/EryC1/StrS family aminotransferase [Kitasatospora sp. NBC_01287]|uniref:DegT/DnrJ/EryC1/StrS family aminotransferase n=1 Tax=Kitasatospora sp. NBC_01287 TaxID=2903573 RepID=UPI00225134CA|nr:DegT/DnrJ/EryC1/StrS family aminotransferase [Kitasatospora sp. NBC_01287]MCX4745126.1 DegT/DnrJ/EryC1/StrS family aminotransferase [Kitasatospora sp. NBC_01287]
MQLAVHGGTPVLPTPHRFVWPRLTDDHRSAVNSLLDRVELSYYGREGEAEAVERLWSRRLEGRHTLAVTSGTAALHSAFYALGAEPGTEVICPTNTFLATLMPLVQTGATPVLADAEDDTGNIDPKSIRDAITPRTVGIAVTHLWGHPCDMDAIMQIADEHGLWVVEDCSHAHGARYHGREVGSIGDAAAISFQSAKLVFAGQGGMFAARDRETFERAVLLGHFRVRAQQDCTTELGRYASTGFGLNYRIHPLSAALARVSTEQMDPLIASRQAQLARLTERLSRIPGLRCPTTRTDCDRGAFYGYKLRLSGEWLNVPMAALVAALQAEGLDVHKPGSAPLHTTAFFTDEEVPVFRTRPAGRRRYQAGDFPVAERVWAESLSLPTFTFADEAPLVEAYADAFEKVHANLAAL